MLFKLLKVCLMTLLYQQIRFGAIFNYHSLVQQIIQQKKYIKTIWYSK